MAEDTRDSNQPPIRSPPPNATISADYVQNAKTYETFNAPPSANALPEGSGLNTAGAHVENPTLAQAIKTVRLEDFKQVYMYPCARESLLNGIGGGFALGGVRLMFGGMD
jgi:cytochrome c oxidase assembly protein subunit 20